MRQPKGAQQPVNGELSREHWIVPIHGLSGADPDGIVQVIARRDGTVILHLTCGGHQTRIQLDVGRAGQLSTGIWEAVGVAQQLTRHLGGEQPRPPYGSGDRPESWHLPTHRNAPRRSPKPRRRPARINHSAVTDATRTIGLRIRRFRIARDKSLRVVSGLAGMSRSTLHRVERGQREPTLSEIVALAGALQIDPAKLIELPILAPIHN